MNTFKTLESEPKEVDDEIEVQADNIALNLIKILVQNFKLKVAFFSQWDLTFFVLLLI